MSNKMRYRWGPLVLKWIDKTTTAAVEQGDMMKWSAGGTITMCTTSANSTELVGIAMGASPASDPSGQSVRIAEIGHGTVFEMTIDDSASYTVGTYFLITGNQTLDSMGEMTSFTTSGTNAVAVCIQEGAGTEILVQFLPGLFQAEIRTV